MAGSRSLLISAALLLPGVASANGTLSFVSEPGDPIANGASLTEDFVDSDMYIGIDGDGLHFYKMTGSPFWLLDFDTGYFGHDVDLACYERAQRAAFHDQGRPGLDFSYNGGGCNVLAGRFKVIDLAFDPNSGLISRAAVDFVQHCGAAGPALYGKLRYNSDVTLDTPPLDPVYTTTGTLHYTSDPGDFIGQGGTVTYALDRFRFEAYTYGNVASMFYQNAPFASYLWRLDLAAADGAPLASGAYPDAQLYGAQAPGHPGMDYSFDDRTCSTLSGEFDINNIAFDPVDGNPSALDAHFEQHCNLATPALHGDIAFTTTFQNGPLVADTLRRDGFDGDVTWPLEWNCN